MEIIRIDHSHEHYIENNIFHKNPSSSLTHSMFLHIPCARAGEEERQLFIYGRECSVGVGLELVHFIFFAWSQL